MERARYLANPMRQDALALGKMAFLSGPRQVGKTTLAKSLLLAKDNYRTWDDPDFRRVWTRSPRHALADRAEGPVVLDEIHKDRGWKSRLKGFFDLEGAGAGLIVTGRARLDFYRKGGDSLLGRFIPYRLHPFSVGECATPPTPDTALEISEPRYLVECKSGQTDPAPSLLYFREKLGNPHCFQLLAKPGHDRAFPAHDLRVIHHEKFLAGLV